MAASEMRGFVFSVVFIIVFSTLLSSIPVGLQGTGASPDTVVPIDPSLITGFSASENYTRTTFSSGLYEYSLGAYTWRCVTGGTSLILAKKILVFGFLWLGQLDYCDFVSSNGTDRETTLTFAEIAQDANEGAIRYSMDLESSGDSAGSFVIYWNITEYPDINDAWTADKLYLLHGMGIDATATTNIGALIVSLLLLQLPDVPVLVNLLLATPIWACIIFVLWFIIKEMIPFV